MNRQTGNRLRQQLADSVTGEVVQSHDKGRGYEVGQNQFLMVEEEELESAQQEAKARAYSVAAAPVAKPRAAEAEPLKIIGSTQKASGLVLFAAKLGQQREDLLAVHERALALRRLSLQSIAMGVNNRLLTVDYNAATLRANTADDSLRKPPLPERIRGVTSAADKLGYWFSRLGLHQVASTLAVEF